MKKKKDTEHRNINRRISKLDEDCFGIPLFEFVSSTHPFSLGNFVLTSIDP